ncbi:MAG: SH3 domain-containing protein [Ruminococcus sp.]|nr:SH3 domain-containing protein [Ruminococcus sp.]
MDNGYRSGRARTRVVGAATVLVTGVFVIAVIFLFAKVLFRANSAAVPQGLDTATLNTNTTAPPPPVTTASSSSAAAPAVTTRPVQQEGDNSAVESTTVTSEVLTIPEDNLGIKYVTQYAYLHKTPAKDSENIICCSPGVAVTVLEEADENGYMLVTFVSQEGVLRGYLYSGYLSDTQTVIPEWQQ